MADGLLKHAILARSGIYQYTLKQLTDSGLPNPPADFPKLELYNVLRPASVLASAVSKSKFDRAPLTVKHPPELVTRDSFRDYAVGWTGDHATLDWLEEDGEVGVAAEVNLKDAQAIDEYNRGVKEISPGYGARFRWHLGEYRGKPVHAIMTEIGDVNHVSMVPRGRGGAVAAILDHQEAVVKKGFVSGLFHKLHKRLVNDEGIAVSPTEESGFERGLYHLIDTRATLTEEEIGKKVNELVKLLDDLPSGDEKSLLMRYMEDMKLMKDETTETLFEAKNIICALASKLDKDADADVSDAEGNMKDCGTCGGTGMKDGKTCPTCDGKKQVKDDSGGAAPDVGLKKTEDAKITTDEPGPVGAPGAPAAAPAGTAPASPAAPAGAAPAQGPKKSPQQWADELFSFLDAMRADLQSAAKPAGGAPAQAAAPAAQPAATPTGAPSAVPAAPAAATPAPGAPSAPAAPKPPEPKTQSTTDGAPETEKNKPVADAMPSAAAKVDTGAHTDGPATGLRGAFVEVNRR